MSIVSMIELSRLYNIDRKIVRKTIADHPNFPYTPAPENDPRVGHKFDTKIIDEWLTKNQWSYGDQKFIPESRETRTPQSIQKYIDEKKNKNNKSEVQTALLQLELDKKRGDLVQRSDVINHFAPRIAMLAKSLEMIPNLIGKKHGLSDAAIRDLRDTMDQIRETLCRSAKEGVMSKDFVTSDDDDD